MWRETVVFWMPFFNMNKLFSFDWYHIPQHPLPKQQKAAGTGDGLPGETFYSANLTQVELVVFASVVTGMCFVAAAGGSGLLRYSSLMANTRFLLLKTVSHFVLTLVIQKIDVILELPLKNFDFHTQTKKQKQPFQHDIWRQKFRL